MTNKKILIVIGAIVLIVIILFIGLKQISTYSNKPTQGSIDYTNPISGQANTDLPGEAFDQAPTVVNRATVTIDGYTAIYGDLTDEQVSNAQSIINDYLLARSGLANVYASISSTSIVQNGNQVSFTMVVNRPQATYQVIIRAANEFQAVPTVTITKEG